MEVKAITICVEYDDLLAITLAQNAKHFSKIVVVTAPQDSGTQAVCRRFGNVQCYTTDAFWRGRGAIFRKGLAMEEGLDRLGRSGWIVIWDADIVMPPDMDLSFAVPGNLYTPHRRILPDPRHYRPDMDWTTLRLTNEQEFPGYFQLFHGDDPVLKTRPWYGIRWSHCGGCDSDFQRRWPPHKKIRPPFHVLHLGEDGRNWHGRITPRLDTGLPPPAAADREASLRRMREERAKGRYAPCEFVQ